MFRIDNDTVVPALPVIPPVGTPGYFTNGNPATGLAPTHVDDWFMNTVQEELMTVVVNAGLTPDKTDHTQLWKALEGRYQRLTSPGAYLPLAGGTLTGPLIINNGAGASLQTTGSITSQYGAIFSLGANAGFEFQDRSNPGSNWILYAQGGVAEFAIVGTGNILAIGSTGITYWGLGTHAFGFTWTPSSHPILWVDGANQGAMVLAADELRLIGGSETPGTYSFTIGPDTHHVFVKCQGAGGGGAQYGSTNTGGGGGAGGYAEGWYAVTPGQVLIYTVGAVGNGGFPGDGQNGGSSSCGSLCSATGGWGGHSVSDAAGGYCGGGAGGNLNVDGGQGGDGHAIAFGNSGAGDGAGSYFGGGMGGQSTLRTGGSAWGSGGGGSYGTAGAGGFYGEVGCVLIYASS